MPQKIQITNPIQREKSKGTLGIYLYRDLMRQVIKKKKSKKAYFLTFTFFLTFLHSEKNFLFFQNGDGGEVLLKFYILQES